MINFQELTNKKGIIIAEIAVTMIFFIFVLYYLVNWIMDSVVHVKEEVAVPEIQGKTLSKALDLLGKSDLALKKIGTEFTRDMVAGMILRQDPEPGAMVRKDRAVKVILSMGVDVKVVPDLVGLSLRDTELELRQNNLSLGEISRRFSLKYKKDEVAGQDPKAGSVVERDAIINVLVSDGEPPENIVLMRDFSESTIDEAKKWASKNDVDIESIADDDFSILPKGSIISQQPKYDDEITAGVSFVVSSGKGALDKDPEREFVYQIPQGSKTNEVKIVLKYENSERVLFKGKKNPGTSVKVPYPSKQGSKIRVFINNILVEEQNN